jgi:hypothetical protein
MTWRRRLFRLWAVLSLAWAGVIGWLAYQAAPFYPRTEAGQQQCFADRSDHPGSGNPFGCFGGLIMADDAGLSANPLFTDYLPAAAAPPLVLLVAGVAGSWLLGRVRRPEHNRR